MARLLITGGAGFIGSHTCLVLLEACHELVVLDNYANSSPEALRRVVERTGVSELSTFVAVLVQSSQLGVSISQVLHTQADQMRVRRRAA